MSSTSVHDLSLVLLLIEFQGEPIHRITFKLKKLDFQSRKKNKKLNTHARTHTLTTAQQSIRAERNLKIQLTVWVGLAQMWPGRCGVQWVVQDSLIDFITSDD